MQNILRSDFNFTKMHGLGNDFIIIDQRPSFHPLTTTFVSAISDRHFGVGCDQVVEIRNSADADAELTFWNSDGSLAETCGNATRCVADLLMRESERESLCLRTCRGLLSCTRNLHGHVVVNMGTPVLDWMNVPLASDVDTLHLPLPGDPVATGLGNPHCSFFVESISDINIHTEGPRFEIHPLFPLKTNVQFSQIISRSEIKTRIWERGAGLTLASGSGACAAVVAGIRRGYLDYHVSVRLDGGQLDISWDGSPESGVFMAGPCSYIFAGSFFERYLSEQH